ncbi:MAG: type VI secretion system tip protein TssI/VgrG [Phycisphaerae bacterium]
MQMTNGSATLIPPNGKSAWASDRLGNDDFRTAAARRSTPTDAKFTTPDRASSAGASGGQQTAHDADFVFSIKDADCGELRVTAFTGTEGMSRLFSVVVELVSDDAGIALTEMLGKACKLEIRSRETSQVRYIQGIVRRFERTGAGSHLTHYEAEIVPLHWYLTQQHRSRIFQDHNCKDMSVPGIVAKVFADAGLPPDSYRFAIADAMAYEFREYVVQYRETDMNFISRLMEEVGIYFYFEHTEDGHRIVIADNPSAYGIDPGASQAVFRETTGLSNDRQHVFGLSERCQIQQGAVTLDDFCFVYPKMELQAHQQADRFTALEWSDYPGRYQDRPFGKQYAQIRLEERQCARQVMHLRANVRTFQPGYRFTLVEHPNTALNREYLVTQVSHVGRQSQSGQEEAVGEIPARSYEANVTVLPIEIVFRPPYVSRRPTVQGSQTAIVVGPKEEEIHTDAYGRVKVQFHWDRYGTYDEFSSCWIRVSQGMAGGQYGMMFLPRVGQEVIVDFLEGDPDRPIITGRVYNNDHMPPYALPDHKTISTIRTCSSKGAKGGNEIRFEDAKGKEQLFFHAQNALHVRALGSRFETVGGESHETVHRNAFEFYKESKHSIVKLDLMEEIQQSKNLLVKGDVREFFDGKQTTYVNKEYNLLNSGGVFFGSDTSITFWVKGNFIKIDEAGIHLVGKVINLNSGGESHIPMPDGPKFTEEAKPADTTEFGHNTRYSATSENTQPPEQNDEKKTSWIEIELIDENGRPMPGEAFDIRTPEGKVLHGTLDEKGQARVALKEPGACEICFTRLDAAAWERI